MPAAPGSRRCPCALEIPYSRQPKMFLSPGIVRLLTPPSSVSRTRRTSSTLSGALPGGLGSFSIIINLWTRCVSFGDHGDEGHLDAALGTEERVDLEDLAQQARPGPSALLQKRRLLVAGVVRCRGRGRRAPGSPVFRMTVEPSQAVGVGAVVADEVLFGIGDLEGEAVDEL